MDTDSGSSLNPACLIFGGISLLRAMCGTGVNCHVAAKSPSDLTRYSRTRETFTSVPALSSHPEQVLDTLIDIGTRFREKPVLYYGNDQTMLFVSSFRSELSEHYRFLMPAAEVLTACSEKGRFSAVAEGLNVRYPRTLIAKDSVDESALERLRPPLVIKPLVSRDVHRIAAIAHSRVQKALLASTVEEALEIATQLVGGGVPLAFQELIPGDESRIFSYHTFNDVGFKALGDFVGRKIRVYPSFGGRSTCLKLVDDPEILEAGRNISSELQIAGPLKLDFKRSADSGELFLMEANPRFTLWNHLGAACGVNLSLMAYQYLTGQAVERVSGYRTDRHWISFADDLRSHLDSRSGRWSSVLSYPFFRNKPVFHTFAWNDPLPSVIALKRQIFRRS